MICTDVLHGWAIDCYEIVVPSVIHLFLFILIFYFTPPIPTFWDCTPHKLLIQILFSRQSGARMLDFRNWWLTVVLLLGSPDWKIIWPFPYNFLLHHHAHVFKLLSPFLKKNMTFHRICSFGKQCECICVFGVCVVISSNITKKAHTMISLYRYSRYFSLFF